MIVGEGLEAWLADLARQHETQAAIDASPATGATAPSRPGSRSASRSAARARAPRRSPRQSRTLFADDAWVDRAGRRPCRSGCARIPFSIRRSARCRSDVHAGLLVFEDRRVSIAAGVTERRAASPPRNPDPAARPRSASPASSPCSSSSRPAARDLASGRRRRSPRASTRPRPAAAARTGERRLEDGDILIIDGRRQSYVIEAARAQPARRPGRDRHGPGAAQRRI